MSKYLITGVCGFIGSHLAQWLVKNDNFVIGIDNYDPFYNKKVKENNIKSLNSYGNFKLYECSILSHNSIREIFNNNDIDIVIHLAAKAGVRPSIKDPIGYYNTNVLGTLHVLECMKEANCNRMIFASSSSVYGNNTKVPFSEEDNVDNPISPYAASKKTGELLCHTYSHLYSFDITCLRFFTVYGPRQRPDLAIHKFTKLILEDKPIPFYGDGTTERDYTYIDDIIVGIQQAILHLDGFNIFNLGESRTISLARMVEAIEQALSKKAIIKKMSFQPGDVKITYADIKKAKNKLGYNPKYSFEEGINNFIKWYLTNNVTSGCNIYSTL